MVKFTVKRVLVFTGLKGDPKVQTRSPKQTWFLRRTGIKTDRYILCRYTVDGDLTSL